MLNRNSLCLFVIFTIFCSLDAIDLRKVPWLTEGAISFLEEFLEDNPEAKILEFGCGASTVWFAKRTPYLYSVEHDREWFEFIAEALNSRENFYRVNFFLRERPYYTICNEFPDSFFDLILIDGRNRKGCFINSIRLLKEGGIIMLDNAERPHYSAALKKVKDWERTSTEQTKPDSEGFFYHGWQTDWWIKPVLDLGSEPFYSRESSP